MLTSQWRDFFNSPEITISAKTLTIMPGTPSDISQYFHALGDAKGSNKTIGEFRIQNSKDLFSLSLIIIIMMLIVIKEIKRKLRREE